MIASTDYTNPNLIRPPTKPAVPEITPLTGMTQPLGAGSTTGLQPPPATDGVSTLPFGNGVQTMTPTNLSPVYSQGIPAPTGSPTLDPSAPGAANPVADPSTDLSNTLIAPSPGAAPLSSAAEQWRKAFGSELMPTDIQAGDINDPRVSQYNSYLDKSVGDLASTDRRSMLSSLLSDFDKQSAIGENADITAAGRRASALGRLGMGNTAQDINQIARTAAGDRSRYRNQLAADTIDKEIADRFGKAGLLGNLSDSMYGRASSDRGFRYGVNRDNQNARTAAQEMAFNFGNNRAGMDYTQGQDTRNELRGERGYQDSRSAYNTDRAIQERQMQEDLLNSGFNRATTQYQTGRQGSPVPTLLGGSQDLSGQSADTMNALMMYLQSLGIGAGSK